MKYTEAQLDQLKALQEKKNQEFLKDFILSQTESQIGNKWTDANLDKEIEKRHLLNVIVDFWQIESIERNILKIPSEYIKIFTQDFYKEIYTRCAVKKVEII